MSSEADTASVNPVGMEPPFVVPHHFSDIDVWKIPERNFYVFIVLSVIFGFFGADHLYIRSFGTAIQKFLFNIITLGMWYIWDIIQIVSDSKKVREEGLTSPFDWIRGIGRGVFLDPKQVRTDGKVVKPHKDIVVYAILTIVFGIFGLDKFYLGESAWGLGKLFANFNLFFFFGWMWVIWDIVNVFLYSESLMKDGITAPPLMNLFFKKTIPAAQLFIPKEVQYEEFKWASLFNFDFLKFHLPSLDFIKMPQLQPFKMPSTRATDVALELLKPPMPPPLPTLPSLETISKPVTNILDGSGSIPTVSDALKVVDAVNTFSEHSKNISGVTTNAMIGGGSSGSIEESLSYAPVIAGTITAITMAGGVKMLCDMFPNAIKNNK